MTSNTPKNFVNLDFKDLKDSLKQYLRSQSVFSDYDFDGSGMSVLLDLLTYNTQYSSYYLNMIANDMFLDSAILRDSVVSRAKHLGYTPRSTRSATARIQLEIFPEFGNGDTAPLSIEVPATTEFLTTLDTKKYFFYPTTSVTIFRDGDGRYKENIELREGIRLSHSWTVDLTQALKQKYIIPNATVDTTSISVFVQNSSTDTTRFAYSLHDNITTIDEDSTVYFLQESLDGKYELIFGDGIIGKALQNGNIITVSYQVSSGATPNGIKTFTSTENISGYIRKTITTLEPARGGTERESKESIKYLAPLNYASQYRAVTKQDYETLIKMDIPQAQFVRVWGGEDNDPVQYGKIFISIKPYDDYSFTEEQKSALVNTVIKKRNIISLEAEIVEPDYLSIVSQIKIFYNSKNTTLNETQIRGKVVQAIEDFSNEQLVGFDADFKYSKFITAIDAADSSIQRNLTSILIKYKIFPQINTPAKQTIFLNNELDRGDSANGISSVYSSGFLYRGVTTYIGDDGKGSLYLYRLVASSKTIIQENIGTVDYITGKVVIESFDVQGFIDSNIFVSLYAIPKFNDISSYRNQILLLEESDTEISLEDTSKR